MVIRSTRTQREEYFANISLSHSFLKEFFSFLDPSRSEFFAKRVFGEEKAHYRRGSANHCLLMRPNDWDDEIYVMRSELPGEKALAVINWAFEQALADNEGGSIYPDILMYSTYLEQGCLPGNALPDGYGGSWSMERKITSLLYTKEKLDEKVINYWKDLCNSQGYTRLTPSEEVIVTDMVNRIKNHPHLGPLFDDDTYNVPGLTAYFEWPIMDITFPLLTFGDMPLIFGAKGMMDFVIVNNSTRDFQVGNLIIRPNHFKVIDLKNTTTLPGHGHNYIRKFRPDRQLAWYTALVQTQYPNMKADNPAILLSSSIPGSEPVLWTLSDADCMIAKFGLSAYKNLFDPQECRNAIANLTPGCIHGMMSLVQKCQMYMEKGITEMRELAIIEGRNHLTTKLWQDAQTTEDV